jgi:excisionase family DNA binding protein
MNSKDLQPNSGSLLLTVKAGAQLLGVSPSTIRSMMASGKLTKIRLGDSYKAQVYVQRSEVTALASKPCAESAAMEVIRKRQQEITAERAALGLPPENFDTMR